MKFVAVLMVCLASAGCGGSATTPIVVYSPHGKDMLSAFEKEYESLHPGVDVQWLDMGSQDALDRIRTERQNPQADVWWGAPMTIFARAEREGLLEHYVPTWDSVVGPDHKSAGGYWYGTFITPEVIMYNSMRIDSADAPHDWDDLLSASWKGKIVIRSPLASGTMRIIISAMIMRELQRGGDVDAGLAWLRRLDANTKSYAADPTQLYIKIAREEGLVTVWDLPDVMMQVQVNHYPFAYILPRSGTPVITDGIAIVKGSRNSAAAKAFYEFVTSRTSMTRQARDFFRIPARTDIPRADLPAWISSLALRPLPLNYDSLAVREKEWLQLWEERVRGQGEHTAGGR
jgi:iron(III) transport system substrate-binding protein